MWWPTPAIPLLGGWKQEYLKFKAILGYMIPFPSVPQRWFLWSWEWNPGALSMLSKCCVTELHSIPSSPNHPNNCTVC